MSVHGLDDYGFVVFIISPFVMGLVSGFVLGIGRTYDTISRAGTGVLGIVFCAAGLLAFAFEGAVCLAMAAPVALPLNILGVWVGSRLSEPRLRPPLLAIAILVIPLGLGADKAKGPFPIRPIVTAIEIDAPPEVVWQNVIDFELLPPPHERIFRLGIAYPVGARIEGRGVDAVRYCDFSTGPFVEPITVWDPPRRLAFDVSAQPDPMHEWSPYSRINAPHLAYGLKSHRGEFRLVELPGGRTLLQGTTWYEVRMSPHVYWRTWSDSLIGGIHRRVLTHVKRLSETTKAD